MGRVENGVPVVEEKYSGGEQEAVFGSAFIDHYRQSREFRRRENPPPGKYSARDEEPTVRDHQTNGEVAT